MTHVAHGRPAAPALPEAVIAGRSRPETTRAGTLWLRLTVIGLVGGVLSGLFAIGGGILMVPLLTGWARMDQRRAAATSLVAIVPTALVSSSVYLADGQIDVVAAVFVALGAVAGAVLGSRLLHRTPAGVLRWMFIAFLLLIAARLVLAAPERGGASVSTSPLVLLGFVALGLVMGVASGLFGIGGGIIAVPLMISLFAVSDLVAKGTSLLVSVPTSVVGTVANRRAGLVDIRAGLVIGVAAAAASVPAAGLALAVPARVSGLLFAGLLVLIAVHLGVKATRTATAR